MVLIRLIRILAWIDALVLHATGHALVFCVEWFSWRRVWIERGFAVVYIASRILSTMHDGRIARTFELLFYGFVGGALYSEANRSNLMRLIKLIDPFWACLRVGSVVSAVLGGVTILMGHLRVEDCVFLVGQFAFVASNYATSLPHGGESGRRRRKALGKLKEWVGGLTPPQPVGT